jgi:hypothetical protein
MGGLCRKEWKKTATTGRTEWLGQQTMMLYRGICSDIDFGISVAPA